MTFLMSPKRREVHTIWFRPADYLKQQADASIGPDPVNPQLPFVDQPDRCVPK